MKVSAKLGSCDLSRAIAKAKGMEQAVTTGVTASQPARTASPTCRTSTGT